MHGRRCRPPHSVRRLEGYGAPFGCGRPEWENGIVWHTSIYCSMAVGQSLLAVGGEVVVATCAVTKMKEWVSLPRRSWGGAGGWLAVTRSKNAGGFGFWLRSSESAVQPAFSPVHLLSPLSPAPSCCFEGGRIPAATLSLTISGTSATRGCGWGGAGSL